MTIEIRADRLLLFLDYLSEMATGFTDARTAPRRFTLFKCQNVLGKYWRRDVKDLVSINHVLALRNFLWENISRLRNLELSFDAGLLCTKGRVTGTALDRLARSFASGEVTEAHLTEPETAAS